MNLLVYLAIAIGLWSAPMEIRIQEWVPDCEPAECQQPNALAWAAVNGDGSCDIWVWPDHFYNWIDEPARQNVVTHEVGHCMGADHHDQPGVMNINTMLITPEPTVWDWLSYIRNKWRFRTFLAGVGYD